MAAEVPPKRGRNSLTITPEVSYSYGRGSLSSVAGSPSALQEPARGSSHPRKRQRASLPPIISRQPQASTSTSLDSHIPASSLDSSRRSGVDRQSENDTEISEREANDFLNEVVMAIDLRDWATIGCSFYIAREETLYMMEDVKSGGPEIIETLRIYAQPTVMLLSSKANEIFEALSGSAHERRETEDRDYGFRDSYTSDIRPSPDFSYEAAKNKLADLFTALHDESQVAFLTPEDACVYNDYNETSEAGPNGRQGKLLRLSTHVDLESRFTVGCAGAILTYLQRRTAIGYTQLDDEATTALRVSNVEMFSLDGIIYGMCDQSHPQSHNQGPTRGTSGPKEGLSVFGLFYQLAKTPQGKYLLRQHFLRPTLNLDIINERLNTVSIKVLENFDRKGLANIGQLVSGIHRTVVKAGVDEELDSMKRTYDGIEDLLGQVSREIADTVPYQYNVDLSVIFFPQIGFLISVPSDRQTSERYEVGHADGEEWDRIFSTGSRLYYKDYRMRELDESFGDIYAMICDKEIDIVYSLSQQVLKYEDLLTRVSDICGELDSLLALAQGAGIYNLSRPQVTEKNVIHIQGGRHLLQELTVPSYVENDIRLSGGFGREEHWESTESNLEQLSDSEPRPDSDDLNQPSMLIMSGPNYSGKSVFLKQIALIVYMAHIGCFVPAETATIGLTDKIITRIATKETVSRSQSSFMIDLQQVALAINLAARRSLVIIDEFGKNTDSSDGAGLVCGVLEYLVGLGNERPKVLGATHFHEIFENGFLQPRPGLTFGHMEVRLDMEAEAAENQIIYLYKSVSCAAMNGVDNAIVKRADRLGELSLKGEDLIAACSSISAGEEKDLQLAERTARFFLEEDLREYGSEPTEEVSTKKPRQCLQRVLAEAEAEFESTESTG
ncbi:MAG: hypothetical protein Q9167_005895 [Letrouitia subvulpina]